MTIRKDVLLMIKRLRESDYRPMSEVTTKLINDRQAQTKELVDGVVDLATELEEAVNTFVPVAMEDVKNFDPNYQDRRILSNANCIARVNKFLQSAIEALERCHPEELLDVDFYKNGKFW